MAEHRIIIAKVKEHSKTEYITNMYNKFWKELYITAFRRLRNEEQVEDILQDLFLSLLESNFSFENETAVRALLHTRLKSRIIDFFRRELLKVSFENQEAYQNEIDDTSSDTRLMGLELESIVKKEIHGLPEKMKEIFLLSRDEMLSNEEIATRLNISNKTVRNQLSAALKRIRITVQHYNAGNDIEPKPVNLAITLAVLLLTKH